ncbi:MAG: hypothetical protein M4579_004575 [Chaenotheca gracillima]|nr:MAG: hypothetical protein M4579_004575 [Chaenotheca gracillima]
MDIPRYGHAFALSCYSHPYILFSTIFVLHLLLNRFRSHLQSIPGPAAAAYTRLWKLYDVWKGYHHLNLIKLHYEYGPVVRIGPKHVSISDPTAIPLIYGMSPFTKTGFYPVFGLPWNKQTQMTIFSTQDEHFNRTKKKLIASAYSLSNLLSLEPFVDSCLALLLSRIGDIASGSGSVDLGEWLLWFSFDVIGEISFAKRLGFLDQGQDVDGIISSIHGIMRYGMLAGQMPESHWILLGNPLLPRIIPSIQSANQVLTFTLQAINTRASLQVNGELSGTTAEPGNDMLSRWLAAKDKPNSKITTRDIVVQLSENVFAGSDTTAITLRAIFYFLCKNPLKMTKLVNTIDARAKEGKLSDPVQYKETATHLPYVYAVMKESMRLNPASGFLLERHVPLGGTTIAGHYIPAGTVVGMSPWAVQRDPNVFPDPESFIPERWIESPPEKLKEMEQAFLAFGSGARICLGRHIATLEVFKLLPQLLRVFSVELDPPDRELKTRSAVLVLQDGLICKLVPRQTSK